MLVYSNEIKKLFLETIGCNRSYKLIEVINSLEAKRTNVPRGEHDIDPIMFAKKNPVDFANDLVEQMMINIEFENIVRSIKRDVKIGILNQLT